MARRRKNAGQEVNVTALNVPAGSDLSLRLEKISQQTGLSQFDLIQKWVLQEEFMLGFFSHREKQNTQDAEVKPARKPRRKISPAEPQEEKVTVKTESSSNRDTLVKRAKKLKSDGWTLKKIADAFNDEKVPTVSGTGKWYTSSVTWLLKSSK